jgi:hypothetical protein
MSRDDYLRYQLAKSALDLIEAKAEIKGDYARLDRSRTKLLRWLRQGSAMLLWSSLVVGGSCIGNEFASAKEIEIFPAKSDAALPVHEVLISQATIEVQPKLDCWITIGNSRFIALRQPHIKFSEVQCNRAISLIETGFQFEGFGQLIFRDGRQPVTYDPSPMQFDWESFRAPAVSKFEALQSEILVVFAVRNPVSQTEPYRLSPNKWEFKSYGGPSTEIGCTSGESCRASYANGEHAENNCKNGNYYGGCSRYEIVTLVNPIDGSNRPPIANAGSKAAAFLGTFLCLLLFAGLFAWRINR